MAAIITKVIRGSIADEMGIEAGDCLVSMAGLPVDDILDYQFAAHDDEIILEVKKKNGELWELHIEKSPD
ncbi:MAG: radical SAM protein, partial [Syntrophomonadaceae bacterium]|nr:radical SAM protein [Syntrophomonadaceae bacterium]